MEIENLIRLIETVSASELTGLKYEENGVKLHLTKKKDRVQVVSVPGVDAGTGSTLEASGVGVAGILEASGVGVSGVPEAEKVRRQDGKQVTSPLVGIFYAAPSEDADPFVTVGDQVRKGQTLAIVEAMKLMNEIESEYDGTIEEIFVENGQTVEYGQPLFRIC